MRYQAILLDADGTMVDSEQVVVNSLAAALQEMQFPPPDDFLKELALRGTSQQVVDFLGISDAQAAIACWNRHWQALMPQCKLYPGIEETLYALKAAGIRLGLVTSRSNYECDADPSLMRLAPLFEARVCVDDVARPKPDPEPIRLCLERMGVSPENALYVGDSPPTVKAPALQAQLSRWRCGDADWERTFPPITIWRAPRIFAKSPKALKPAGLTGQKNCSSSLRRG